jgi:hypothetical protein
MALPLFRGRRFSVPQVASAPPSFRRPRASLSRPSFHQLNHALCRAGPWSVQEHLGEEVKEAPARRLGHIHAGAWGDETHPQRPRSRRYRLRVSGGLRRRFSVGDHFSDAAQPFTLRALNSHA